MRSIVLAFTVTSGLIAQTPPDAPAFEVASIKRNLSGDDFADGGFQPGGRITAVNVTLRNLMIAAYGTTRIEGGLAWVTRDRFDVVATVNRNASVAETRQMLRTLLADRFKLVTRTETRDTPIFLLMMAGRDSRLGPQLRATSPACAAARVASEGALPAAPPDSNMPRCGAIGFGGGSASGRAVTLDQIAGFLGNFVGRPVRNQSAIAGLFDFELKFSRTASSDPTQPPEIVTAVREQLGLRFEPSRGSVEVLVLVNAEQPTID